MASLRARGYDVEGVDFAQETIERIKEVAPQLPVWVGDVTSLDKSDGQYAGYISIGVVEHFFYGPDECLKEAYRVLTPGGIALFTVPYLNFARRRLLQKIDAIDTQTDSMNFRFYQYYFSEHEFVNKLRSNGFVLKEINPYLIFGGFIRDYRIGKWLFKHSFFSYRVQTMVKRVCMELPISIRYKFAHMMLFACEKPVKPLEVACN